MPETGLYFYRARYYDPVVGRWLSEDPLGFGAGQVNLFQYVGNSPTGWIDPWGLRKWTINRMGAGGSFVLVGASAQYITFISDCEDGQIITKRYVAIGVGLTVGLQVNTTGPTKGQLGGTTFMKEPDPTSGISATGPSLGIIYGGTIGSTSTDFNSYGEAYGANHGWMFGASLFNFEGQFYLPIGEIKKECCEGNN